MPGVQLASPPIGMYEPEFKQTSVPAKVRLTSGPWPKLMTCAPPPTTLVLNVYVPAGPAVLQTRTNPVPSPVLFAEAEKEEIGEVGMSDVDEHAASMTALMTPAARCKTVRRVLLVMFLMGSPGKVNGAARGHP